MKKKAVSLLLVTVMAASMIAGCGNNAGGNAGTDAGTDAGTNAGSDAAADNGAAVDSTEAPAAAGEGAAEEEAWAGTITVWSPQEDQDTGWLSAQCDAFNEAHPNWDITFAYGVCAEGDAKTTVTQDVEGSADVYILISRKNYTHIVP